MKSFLKLKNWVLAWINPILGEFLEKSGIKKEFKYIYGIIPKNKMIILFLFIIPISSFIFYTMMMVGFFFIVYFNIDYIFKRLTKKNFIMKFTHINNFNNTKLYLIKEIIIEYPKSKSFIIFYNIIKILNKKNNNKKIKIKHKIFSYLIKKLFYIITLIPFLIFKINCILFEEIIKISKWNTDSLSAYIDNFLYGICLANIVDFINYSENYRIIIKNKTVDFNPPKSDKYFFKNIGKYLAEKKSFEDNSEFRILNSKKTNDGSMFKHYCKAYNPFNWVYNKNPKFIIFEETKSKQILDNKGNIINSKLEDCGSKNENIVTNKIGPIVTENKPGILTTIPINMIKDINEIKKKYSWNLVNEVFYNSNIINLNKNNIIEKNKNETLKDFYLKNFKDLNDITKKFVEAKEKFDAENNDIMLDMSNEELEKNLKNDFKKFNESEFNLFDDFKENKLDYEDYKNDQWDNN